MIPELNHVSSFGDSFAEAEANVKEAALGYMETVIERKGGNAKTILSLRRNLYKNIRSGQCLNLTLCRPKSHQKLESAGFVKTHQRGSHIYLKKRRQNSHRAFAWRQ